MGDINLPSLFYAAPAAHTRSDRRKWLFVGVCARKWQAALLCQNCVRWPLKSQTNTMISGDTPMHIVVAGSRWWELCWWVLMSVSTRGPNLFPSVLLQPLG